MTRAVYETELWCARGHFNRDQADKYAELCRRIRPRYVLETGFCTGRSAACLLHYTGAHLLKFISVDKNLDYKRPEGRLMAALLMETFPAFSVIEASSTQLLSDSFLSQQFSNGLDWVTVDGDHSYAGCMADLSATAPYLNAGGLIVVDDYNSGPPNGRRIESVTNSVNDFLRRNSTDFEAEFWNMDGKAFCIITRRYFTGVFGAAGPVHSRR